MDLLPMTTFPLRVTGVPPHAAAVPADAAIPISRSMTTTEEIAGLMTFVIGNGFEQTQLEASLAALRDAKGSFQPRIDRRLVWLHAEIKPRSANRGFSKPINWEDLGSQVARDGNVDVFVATGLHARNAALGAREAGMFLGDVIVCTDQATACHLMIDRVVPGDCVLLHEVDELAGKTLRHAIEMKWTHAVAA